MADSSETLVRRTAALARLEVADEECAHLARDFASILAAFRSLAEAPVEPGELAPPPAGSDREDVPEPFPAPERLFALAPETVPAAPGIFLAVPKIVGGGA